MNEDQIILDILSKVTDLQDAAGNLFILLTEYSARAQSKPDPKDPFSGPLAQSDKDRVKALLIPLYAQAYQNIQVAATAFKPDIFTPNASPDLKKL